METKSINVFIIHGSGGDAFTNWIPWLVSELKDRKITVIVPAFPTPDLQKPETWPGGQKYVVWKELLDFYYNNLIITEDTIFVSHSTGSICIARYLSERNIKALGLITTAGYNNFWSDTSPMIRLNESFYVKDNKNFDVLKTNIKTKKNFYGSDDPFIPQVLFEEFTKAIDAEAIVVQNGGHLNSKSGYVKFEALLEAILHCNNGN